MRQRSIATHFRYQTHSLRIWTMLVQRHFVQCSMDCGKLLDASAAPSTTNLVAGLLFCDRASRVLRWSRIKLDLRSSRMASATIASP